MIVQEPAPKTASRQVEGAPLIRLEGVNKIYQTISGEFFALRDVSAQVFPDEFLCIIGKSGAGKTTLLNMITGVDAITSGIVTVNDVTVHSMSEDRLAQWRGRNLGIIYQSFELMPMLTLLENVMLPMDFCGLFERGKSRQKAEELLTIVELQDHMYKLPNAISGGQQQRVAIARALANDPPLIIADEPTGRLDSSTAETILEIFERLVQTGKTIVMVTHDATAAYLATRVLEISDGQIVSEAVHKSQMKALKARKD